MRKELGFVPTMDHYASVVYMRYVNRQGCQKISVVFLVFSDELIVAKFR